MDKRGKTGIIKRLFVTFTVMVTGVALAGLGACSFIGLSEEKKAGGEKSIGLGGAYIKTGDSLSLNAFFDNDEWEVVDNKAKGEVSLYDSLSEPFFVMEKACSRGIFDNKGSGDYSSSSIKDSLDRELLKAKGSPERARYTELFIPTYTKVDDKEYKYSQNSALKGDTVFIPSYSEYLDIEGEEELSKSQPMWTRSSKEGSKTLAYLTNGSLEEGNKEYSYRRAANVDIGINKVLYSYKGELPSLKEGSLTEIKEEWGISSFIKRMTGKGSDSWKVRSLDDSIKLYWDNMSVESGKKNCKISISGLFAENDDYYYLYESGQLEDLKYEGEDNKEDSEGEEKEDKSRESEELEKHRVTDIAVMVTDKAYLEEASEILYYGKAENVLEKGELSFELNKKLAGSAHVYLVAENKIAAGRPVEIGLGRELSDGLRVSETTVLNKEFGEDNTTYTITTEVRDSDEKGTVSGDVVVTEGGTATITATPNKGYTFSGWYKWVPGSGSSSGYYEDDPISTSKKLVLSGIKEDAKYGAKFTTSFIDVEVEVVNPEGGYVEGGGALTPDGSLTFNIVASDNYSVYFINLCIEDSNGSTSIELSSELSSDGKIVLYGPENGNDSVYKSNDLYEACYKHKLKVSFKKSSANVIIAMYPQIGYVQRGNPDPDGDLAGSLGGSAVQVYSYDDVFENIGSFYSYYYIDKIATFGLTGKKDDDNSKLIYDNIYNNRYSFKGAYFTNIEGKENHYDSYTKISGSGSGTQYVESAGARVGTVNIEYKDKTTITSIIALGRDPTIVCLWKPDDGTENRMTYNYNYGAITAAVPKGAGSTSGDMASYSAFTTSITAYPNEGYMFDHWEWYENADSIVSSTYLMKSKENPMSVSPNGINVYKAVFTKTTYEVRLVKTDPEGCGSATGIGSYGKGEDATVTAVVEDGYEFESWSYKTEDGVEHVLKTPTIKIEDIKEDYNLTLKCKKTSYDINLGVSPLGVTVDDQNVITGYNKASIRSNDGNSLEIESDGKSVTQKVKSDGSFTLFASPNTIGGYKFKQWVGSDGTVSANNPLTISNIKDDMTFIAEFELNAYTLTLKSDPVNAGKAVAVTSDYVKVKDAEGTYNVTAGESVTIKASLSSSDYTFLYWTNNAGEKFYGNIDSSTGVNTLILEAFNGDDTYTAHFIEKSMYVTVKKIPGDVGEVNFKYVYEGNETEHTISANTASYKTIVDAGSSITLSASILPAYADEYKFERWDDSKGNSYSTNPLTISSVEWEESYTAVFSSKYNSDQYTFGLGLSPKDSGSVRLEDKTGGDVKLLDSSASYSESDYNGEELSDSMNYLKLNAGANITLSATPKEGYRFKQWVGNDGTVSTNNPYTLANLKDNMVYRAEFVKNTYTLTLKSDPVSGGKAVAEASDHIKVKDVEGTYSVSAGESVTIKASPSSSDYIFLYWTNNAGEKFYGNTDGSGVNRLTLTAFNGDDSYTAHFTESSIDIKVKMIPVNVGSVKFEYVNGGIEKEFELSEEIPSYEAGVDAGSSITLSASILPAYADEYKFERWDDSKGNSYSTNPLTVSRVEWAESYTAVFSSKYNSGSYTFGLGLTPEGSGSVKLEDKTGGAMKLLNPDSEYKGEELSDSMNYLKLNAGANVSLSATPKEGYRFKQWVGNDGTVSTNNPYTLANLKDNMVYRAEFVENTYTLTLKSDPVSGGKAVAETSDYVKVKDVEGSYSVTAGKSLTIKASPSSNAYTFLYWTNSAGEKFYGETDSAGVNTLTLDAFNGDDTYTAHFTGSSIDITVAMAPENVGKVVFEYVESKAGKEATVSEANSPYKASIDAGSSITLSASILPAYADEYRFERWDDSKGKSYTANPLSIANIDWTESYTAIFVNKYNSDQYTFGLGLTPEGSGSVKLEDKRGSKVYYMDGITEYGGEELSSNMSYLLVGSGANITLSAAPKEGYRFKQWVGNDGTVSTNNPYTLANLKDNMVYRAEFVKNAYTLTLKSDPVSGGKARANTNDKVTVKDAEGIYLVEGGSAVTITASPSSKDYIFRYWTNSAGEKFYGETDTAGVNSLTLDAFNGDDTYTAHFTTTNISVTVEMTPDNVGQVVFDYYKSGSQNKATISQAENPFTAQVDEGSSIVLSASILPEFSQEYKFERWDDSNGKSYTANPLTVTDINWTERYRAVFVKKYNAESYTITVNMTPDNSGITKLDPAYTYEGISYGGVYMNESFTYPGIKAGSSIMITAEPLDGYEFEYFTDSAGNMIKSNPITVTNLSKDESYTAVFNPKEVGIKVVASPASGGKVTRTYNSDGSVTIKAQANRGYKFVRWSDSTGYLTSDKDYRVSKEMVARGDTYTAYFVIDMNYDAKSDIIKYNFYVAKRIVLNPDYKVTRATMQAQASAQIAEDEISMYGDNAPSPKDYEAYGMAEAYYEELSSDKFNPQVLLLEEELYTTDGEIAYTEPDENSLEDVCAEFTLKKFGDIYVNDILASRAVTFKDSKGNAMDMGTKTYIWKDTGAVYKDNVYVIYSSRDKLPQHDYDWVSARVAHDGSLTFTIDHLEPGALMTVVRVLLE